MLPSKYISLFSPWLLALWCHLPFLLSCPKALKHFPSLSFYAQISKIKKKKLSSKGSIMLLEDKNSSIFSTSKLIYAVLYVKGIISLLHWINKHYDLTSLLPLQFLTLNWIAMTSYLCRNTYTNERSLYWILDFQSTVPKGVLPTFYPQHLHSVCIFWQLSFFCVKCMSFPSSVCPSRVLIILIVLRWLTQLRKLSFSLLLLFFMLNYNLGSEHFKIIWLKPYETKHKGKNRI
jgi:hypothetical protein